MRAFTVRYRVPGGPLVSMDVLAGCGTDAAQAVLDLVPTARLVETRGTHLGLDTVGAEALCAGCGHAAKLHTTEEWTGDGCEHVGHGHGNGQRHSFHPCSCQGFFA